MTPETCNSPDTSSNIPGTEEAQAVNVALDWTDYAEQQPLDAGPYEWQVPSTAVKGMTVRVLAHFRKRGAGYKDVLSPEFDHWDGYRVHVPTGTKWRPVPEGTELKQYEQKLVCVEGLDFVPCPYCNRKPRLNGVRRASDGGVVITGDAHTFNSWWLECCSWTHTPRYSDPRELENARSAVLTAQSSTIASAREVIEQLLPAAEKVLEGLHARIDAAENSAVPVFYGISDLHDAIGAVPVPASEPEPVAWPELDAVQEQARHVALGLTGKADTSRAISVLLEMVNALRPPPANPVPTPDGAVEISLERYRAQEPFGGDMVSNPQGTWVRFDDAMAKIAALSHPADGWREDTARLDALRDNSWDLRCFDIATGGDDSDIGWRVIGHWQAKPQERVVSEVYNDDPRAAIDAARSPAAKPEGE